MTAEKCACFSRHRTAVHCRAIQSLKINPRLAAAAAAPSEVQCATRLGWRMWAQLLTVQPQHTARCQQGPRHCLGWGAKQCPDMPCPGHGLLAVVWGRDSSSSCSTPVQTGRSAAVLTKPWSGQQAQRSTLLYGHCSSPQELRNLYGDVFFTV